MKLFFLAAAFLCHFPLAEAKPIAYYTYLKAKKPVKKAIQLEDLKRAYDITRQSTFTPPDRETFFKDYLRYKMGVEAALSEKKLVKNPDIENQIANPFLKEAFRQELYKSLAELKLKSQMESLDKKTARLSDSFLKTLYAQEPEFNIFFISVQHPVNPSPKQAREAENRAKKIYARAVKSKKPFLELVALYSDDKSNGTLGINRSRANILPAVYAKLKGMKNNSISPPIRAAGGFYIVKLNQRVPFSQANKTAIKANYFNKERSKAFNSYFDSLKKDFKVNIANRALIKTI